MVRVRPEVFEELRRKRVNEWGGLIDKDLREELWSGGDLHLLGFLLQLRLPSIASRRDLQSN